MKTFVVTITLVLISVAGSAQEFLGYRTSNYAGVNGVFFNPATIAGNAYKWNVNLASIHALVNNNQAAYTFKSSGHLMNPDSLLNELTSPTKGATDALVATNIIGPSAMLRINQNSAVALTTRSRVMVNGDRLEGRLFDNLAENFTEGVEMPYTINSNENMKLNINTWTEYGLSYARSFSTLPQHQFKAGASVKYLAGVFGGYLQLDRIKATVDEDPQNSEIYMADATGKVNIGMSGINFKDINANKFLTVKNSGWGADIGFVYEYRNNLHRPNEYKFRLGASVLDIGRLKYKKDQNRSGAYSLDVTGAERIYSTEFQGLTIDDLKQYLDSRLNYFIPDPAGTSNEYTTSLPTTLQVDADYSFSRRIFLNFAGNISLQSNGQGLTNRYPTGFSVTPRFESRVFSAFLPVNYNSFSHLNVGLGFRAGPLFIGSGSAITALFGNSKQADFYIGINFGALIRR